MRLHLLGPLRIVAADGSAVPVPSRHHRQLLAVLAVSDGRVVSRDRLIAELWGDHPPRSAAAAVQVYVSALRKVLGSAVIETIAPGYRLNLAAIDVDVAAFDRAVDAGLDGVRQRRFADATHHLDAALALCGGEPFGEFADDDFARTERSRLIERRLVAIETRYELHLETGTGPDAVAQLSRLVEEHPERERLVELLATACYREGRQTEALAVLRSARRRLDTELGLEPGPALRRLEEAVLNHTVTAPATGRADSLEHVPALSGATFGRDADLTRIRAELSAPGGHVLTLTGPGGVGKTRLSLEVAHSLGSRYQSTRFVDLQAATGVEAAVATIAAAVGIVDAGRDTVEELAARLASRSMLLVLDNLEQVLAVAPALETMLRGATGVDAVLTSRSRLGLDAEREIVLAPLTVPDESVATIDAALGSPAVQLFVARMRAVDPGFRLDRHSVAGVVGLCRALDGLPLAIELAAAQCRATTPAELLDRLANRLLTISANRPDVAPRQRTLLNLIEWSHELVGPEAGRLLTVFGAFAGTASLDAFEAVADVGTDVANAVTVLVDHSLIRRVTDRFEALESVRVYAASCLDEWPDRDEVRDRHAGYFARPLPQHLDEAAIDVDNLRVAAAWAQPRHPDVAARIGLRLVRHLNRIGLLREAERRIGELLESGVDPAVEIRLRLIRQDALFQRGRDDESVAEVRTTLALARTYDDVWGIARCCHALGWRAMLDDELDLADQYCLDGRDAAQRCGDLSLAAAFSSVQGAVAMKRGDLVKALQNYADTTRGSLECGDTAGAAVGAINSIEALLLAGDVSAARGMLEVSRAMVQELHIPRFTLSQTELDAAVALADGDATGAAGHYRDAMRHRRAHQVEVGITSSIGGLAGALLLAGRVADAYALLAACDRLVTEDAVHQADEVYHRPNLERLQAQARSALSDDEAAAAVGRYRALIAELVADTACRLVAQHLRVEP